MPIVSPLATAAAKLSGHQRQSPPRPRAGRASRSSRPSTARPSTALAGDRRRAGAGTHTEPFRSPRAAPSTCEAGAARDINSAPSSQRTSLSNLWQVYLTACSPPECESENLSWSALDNGAKAYYGTNNLRYLKLVASGSNFGVNH